jgi:hypothetical protein
MTRPRWLAPLLGDLRALLCMLAVVAMFALVIVGRLAVAVVQDIAEAARRMTG